MDEGGRENQLAIVNEAEKREETNIPLGFRFAPTDYELMKYYLIPQVNGELIWSGIIREDIDVYQCQPADIPGIETEADFVYFFTKRDRKYLNGSRPDRCTKDQKGSWKLTSKINKIYDEDKKVLGYKHTLVYRLKDLTKKEKQAKEEKDDGIKTNWIMHEYVLAETHGGASNKSSSSMMLDGVVLCRIYERNKTKKEKESENSQILCHEGSQNISPATLEDDHQQAHLTKRKMLPIQQFVSSEPYFNSQPDAPQPHLFKKQRPQFVDNPTTPFYVDASNPSYISNECGLHQPVNFSPWPSTEVNCPGQTYQLNQSNLGQEENFRPVERNEQKWDEVIGQPQAFGVVEDPMPLGMQPGMDYNNGVNTKLITSQMVNQFHEFAQCNPSSLLADALAWYEECKRLEMNVPGEHHDLQLDNIESNGLPNDTSTSGCNAPPSILGLAPAGSAQPDMSFGEGNCLVTGQSDCEWGLGWMTGNQTEERFFGEGSMDEANYFNHDAFPTAGDPNFP